MRKKELGEKKSFKQRLEENIFYVIGGVGLFIGTVVYKATSYIENNNYKRAVSNLEQKVSEYNFVAPDSSIIDATKLVIYKNDEVQNFENLKYYSQGSFYALKEPENWTSFTTDDNNVVSIVSNIDKSQSPFIIDIDKSDSASVNKFELYKKNYPIYLWKYKEPIKFISGGKQTEIFPFILVQKFDKRSIKLLSEITPIEKLISKELQDLIEKSKENEINDTMDIGYNIGEYLFNSKTMNYYFEMLSNGINIELSKVYKNRQFQYGKINWESPGLKDGEKYTEFYMIEEFIVLNLGDEVVSINIKTPSNTPNLNTKLKADIRNLLVNFRFVKSY